MNEMYKLTEDGKGIVYIPEDTVAPNLQCVVDNLNDMSKQVYELKTAFEKIGVSFDLVKDFSDWHNRIEWLDKTNRRLILIEKDYKEMSERLLSEASKVKQETDVDVIKEKYGGNNDKTRKKYVEEELKDLLQEKQELKLLKENDNREISFLKRVIDLKINLIRYNNADIELPK